MQVGDKLVCIDAGFASSYSLVVGQTYTFDRRDIGGAYCFSEIVGGWSPRRFKTLEEMQNTNFVAIAAKEQK